MHNAPGLVFDSDQDVEQPICCHHDDTEITGLCAACVQHLAQSMAINLVSNYCRQNWHRSSYTAEERVKKRRKIESGSSLGQTFSLPYESMGYPVVALIFQRVISVHLGIIHANQLDRNRGGAIWSRIDIRDG